MLAAYPACNFAVHSSSVEGVAGVARQLGHILATAGSAMSADMNASVAVVWARLSMDSRRLGSEPRRRAGCARAHARGEAVGIARSRSC